MSVKASAEGAETSDFRDGNRRKKVVMSVRAGVALAVATTTPSAAQPTTPGILVVFVSEDFGQTFGVVGFNWEPGTQVTLAVDNGDDGIIDYTSVVQVDEAGDARFDNGFSVGEGDLLTLTDDRDPPTVKNHIVVFFTVAEVNPDLDLVRGAGREGTELFGSVRHPR